MKRKPFARLDQVDLNFLKDYPLDEGSPLGFDENLPAEAVRDLPFIRLCRHFLADLQAQQPMKLTTKGNLSRKFVHQLYDYRIYPSEYVDQGRYKILKEEDSGPIHLSHILLGYAGAVKKRNNKLSLTKKGEKLLANEGLLYGILLEVYTAKYNWAYQSYFDPEHVGQFGWAYVMYWLLEEGDQERDSDFYAEKYLRQFPWIMRLFPDRPYSSPHRDFLSAFRHRFFDTFCDYFGLADLLGEKDKWGHIEDLRVRRSALAEAVFGREDADG